MNETIITEHPEQNQLKVTRDFSAPINLVWSAFTEPELIDQWLAPKPWKAKTESMDFREGGTWLYTMNGPEGEKHWARADFLKIVPEKMYEVQDVFCDEHGNANPDLPSTHWHVQFTETETGTRLEVIMTFASEEALKQLVEMGFKEGYTMSHANLDELLETLLAVQSGEKNG